MMGEGYELLHFYDDGKMRGTVGDYIYTGTWVSKGNQEYEINANTTNDIPVNVDVVLALDSSNLNKSLLYIDSKNSNYFSKMSEEVAFQDQVTLSKNLYYQNSTFLNKGDFLAITLIADNSIDFMIVDSENYENFQKAIDEGGNWNVFSPFDNAKVVRTTFKAPSSGHYYVIIDNSDLTKGGAYTGLPAKLWLQAMRLTKLS